MSEAQTDDQKVFQPKKNKKIPLIVLGGLFLIGLIVFFWWLIWARFTLSTNDAYVHGNQVEVYPQINGSITSIYFQETDYVKEGDPLIELDRTDALLAFEQSQAQLANTVRQVVQKFDQVYQLKAAIEVRQSELLQAQVHYNNREPLVEAGAVTKEEFQNAEIALLSAKAAICELTEQLRGAEAQIYNTSVQTHPLVLEAKEKVREAWLNLSRTCIKAPVEGYIAQRAAQVGESAMTQRPLLSIVPLDEIWVNANFKEVQLSKIKVGQTVTLTSSLYGNKVEYTGQVVGISPGTGGVFSVLPPQNATGNWIKIIQRVPVKIKLNPNDFKNHPLRVGLTMNASINLKDSVASVQKRSACDGSIYSTQIFDQSLMGVDPIIERIIAENINPSPDETCL